jgi:hypothetical protein
LRACRGTECAFHGLDGGRRRGGGEFKQLAPSLERFVQKREFLFRSTGLPPLPLHDIGLSAPGIDLRFGRREQSYQRSGHLQMVLAAFERVAKIAVRNRHEPECAP